MSAGVVGRIEAVVQPVHGDRRLVIYANRAARFDVAGLACLDECHTFSRAVSLCDEEFCITRSPPLEPLFYPLPVRSRSLALFREDQGEQLYLRTRRARCSQGPQALGSG